MNNSTQYRVGDKVFAKVKGYPPWPAIILEATRTKYNVQFYGTGETGSVKSKDLFYYLAYKETYSKSNKRKGYKAAIVQIENAIDESGGTDGNTNSQADAAIDSGKVNTSATDASGTKDMKRKRATSVYVPNGKEDEDVDSTISSNTSVTDSVANITKVVKRRKSIHVTQLDYTGYDGVGSSEDDEEMVQLERKPRSKTPIPDQSGRKSLTKTPVVDQSGRQSQTKTPVLDQSGRKSQTRTPVVDQSGRNLRIKTPNFDQPGKSPSGKTPTSYQLRKSPRAKTPSDQAGRTSKTPTALDDASTEDLSIGASEKPLHNGESADDQMLHKKRGENDVKPERADDERKISISDVTIITVDYLKALIDYADKVRNNRAVYKRKPAEERIQLKYQVVMVKLPNGKHIGIKYNWEPHAAMKWEYDSAEHDEVDAKLILSLQSKLEDGSVKFDEEGELAHLYVTNLDTTESEIAKNVERGLVTRKHKKLKWLKRESTLIEYDVRVKQSLGLDKAEPEDAITHLHSMLALDIHPLMLKKHPHVVDMIKRLRRYIGNLQEWNLSEEETLKFENVASGVRDAADQVYAKFASLFNVPDGEDFATIFREELLKFKELVKHMTQSQIFALSSEPDSRQTFFNHIDEQEEMRIFALENEGDRGSNFNKSNSSEVINSDRINSGDPVVDSFYNDAYDGSGTPLFVAAAIANAKSEAKH